MMFLPGPATRDSFFEFMVAFDIVDENADAVVVFGKGQLEIKSDIRLEVGDVEVVMDDRGDNER